MKNTEEVTAGQTWRALKHPRVVQLLMIAMFNALPVAVTSTLFLFFVEDRLQLPDLAGLFLVLFFLTAGISAPFWSKLASRFGARQVLVFAMCLAIAAFVGAYALPVGAAWRFGLISALSGGRTWGRYGDPARRFRDGLGERAGAYGDRLWSVGRFRQKSRWRYRRRLFCRYCRARGFTPAGPNTPEALRSLNLLYAVFPCALKVFALILVARLPDEQG